MNQGFEAEKVTRVQRGALAMVIGVGGLGAMVVGLYNLILEARSVLPSFSGFVLLPALVLAALARMGWVGTHVPAVVRANRQGLWIGGDFFPIATLGWARRRPGARVRIFRLGLHLPIELCFRDDARAESLVRALGLDATGRDEVEIGADGILVKSPGRRRYIHHGAVARASASEPRRDGGIDLVLADGERVALRCRPEAVPGGLWQIQQAMAACAGDGAAAEVPLLRRGARGLRGWVAELRAVGVGAGAAHRIAPIRSDRLWRIVESPASPPAMRAAAAVALGPRLDARDRDRLRAAASATTAPRLRVALDAAAGAVREAELEALLAEVEQEDAPARQVNDGGDPHTPA